VRGGTNVARLAGKLEAMHEKRSLGESSRGRAGPGFMRHSLDWKMHLLWEQRVVTSNLTARPKQIIENQRDALPAARESVFLQPDRWI